MIDEESVGDALGRWQSMLRLHDWDIRTEIVRGAWRKSGDIKIDAQSKLSVLLVHENIDPKSLDEIVIHELVHLRLYGLDQMIEELISAVYGTDDDDPKRSFAYGMFMDRLESTTQDLTKALLSAGGREHRLLSKSLQEEMDEEIKRGSHAHHERERDETR